MPTYDTHDNGGRAYRVKVTNNGEFKHVVVREITTRRSRPLFQLDSPEIFVGKSPVNAMTRFSGGHGPAFDGNTILVSLSEDNVYLYIGESLLVFRTKANPVVEYQSPVGNNDVPYPWAVDSMGNYYLIIEKVVLLANPSLRTDIEANEGNPYTYYYRRSLMGPDRGTVPPKLPIGGNYQNLDHMEVGQEQYTLRYDVNPGPSYDRLIQQDHGDMILVYSDGEREEADRERYIELNESFGRYRGFELMDIVEERQHQRA